MPHYRHTIERIQDHAKELYKNGQIDYKDFGAFNHVAIELINDCYRDEDPKAVAIPYDKETETC